jgi:hypothetical protein
MIKGLMKNGITLFSPSEPTYLVPHKNVHSFLKQHFTWSPALLGYVSFDQSLLRHQTLEEALELENSGIDVSQLMTDHPLKALMIHFKDLNKTVSELSPQERFMVSLYKAFQHPYEHILIEWDDQRLEPLACAILKKLIVEEALNRHIIIFEKNKSHFQKEAQHLFDGKALHPLYFQHLRAKAG